MLWMMYICWIPIILLYILCVYWFLLLEIFPYCDGIYDLRSENPVGAVQGINTRGLFYSHPHADACLILGVVCSWAQEVTSLLILHYHVYLFLFVWNFATLPVFQFGSNIDAILFMLSTLLANCLMLHLVL